MEQALLGVGRKVPASALTAGWQPLAAAFHYGTRDVEWLQGAEDEAFEAAQERRAGADPPPAAYKKLSGPGKFLTPGPYTGEFTDVLLARRTWRGFGVRQSASGSWDRCSI